MERSSHSSQRGGLCYSRGGPGGGTKTNRITYHVAFKALQPQETSEMNHTVCGINIPIIPDGGALNVCLWDNKGRRSDFIFQISSAVFL